jgi:hypothetical protein
LSPEQERSTFIAIPRSFRSIGTAIAATAAIALAASHIRPVFLGREPVVQRLVAMSWRDSVALPPGSRPTPSSR